MPRNVTALLARVVSLAAVGLLCCSAGAPAAAPAERDVTIWRAGEAGGTLAGALQERGDGAWRIVRERPDGDGHRAPSSVDCSADGDDCAIGAERLRASCDGPACQLDLRADELRADVPFRALWGDGDWELRDRAGDTLGWIRGLDDEQGEVALLAATAVLCREAVDSTPGDCFDPRRAVAGEQRAEARKRRRVVPLGTHGLVWRYHLLALNFVAQVEIDGQDDAETDWLVSHTHTDGIRPGRTGTQSRIVCRDRDGRDDDGTCTMNGPAVRDLAASCSRRDRCELDVPRDRLRRKVPATATRGPLNWIVRDAGGNRLGRVGKLGKGYPDGAVALLAATTMLCPEAAADYVGCPSPVVATER